MDNILKEQLSEDLQTNESLGKFNDANGLAKSYVELENKFGSIKEEHETKLSELQGKLDKAIQIPGKDADDNTRKQFYQKLGCPEKPENYSAIEIEGIPEGFEKDEEITTKIRHACCEAGISDNQYKAVMTQLVKEQLVSLDNFVKQDKQAEEEAVATLTQKWGGDAKYKEKVEFTSISSDFYGFTFLWRMYMYDIIREISFTPNNNFIYIIILLLLCFSRRNTMGILRFHFVG